jgi:hypothetical protein
VRAGGGGQNLAARVLELAVFDDDGLSRNDFIGHLHLPLADLLAAPAAGWFELLKQRQEPNRLYVPTTPLGPRHRRVARAHGFTRTGNSSAASELIVGAGELVELVRIRAGGGFVAL